MMKRYRGFSMSDDSKKNMQNPDFLWDFEELNKEMSEMWLKASAGLMKDVDNLEKQLIESQEEDEE